MFRTKICGITNPHDAALVAAVGVDAVGLNFFPGSRRFISMEAAEPIVAALPKKVLRVGLFVDATDDEVSAAYDHLQLDLIQLHGNEPPEFLASLGGRPVLRAFRLGQSGIGPITGYLEECRTLGCEPAMVLIDADVPGQFGGTGETADWNLLAQQRDQLGSMRLVLAGGLTPANVAGAIEQVRPDAVDTASGVEIDARRKDPDLSRAFVSAAAQAFRQ